MNHKERCSHIKGVRAGDEGMDFCELTERVSGRIQGCVLMSGAECQTWEEIKKEWEDE